MRVVFPTVMHSSETRSMRLQEKDKVDVADMQCLRSMFGFIRWDGMRNKGVRESRYN